MDKDNNFASKYKPEYARQLYQHCAGGKSASCFRITGLTRQTIWNWLHSKEFRVPEFVEARENGEDAWQDFLEGLKYYKITGIISEEMKKMGINKIDGEMLRFELKTKFKKDYAEKTEIEHTGKVPVTIIYEEVE